MGIAGAAIGALALVLGGWYTARATKAAAVVTAEAQRAAAVAAAAPATTTSNLAVLEATVKRLDQENDENRVEIRGLRALVRAYSWTVERLITRMRAAGAAPLPEDIDDLVKEHMRTGV
ncbi:hypothetical protein [Streptomyces sp. MI02-7b]|uniref:hypothetical protein n=1 Tax=Streptomyces sp. MI02-7b TaxID=462941 RepID=UPI0029A1ECDC|nr:hypothetical protein [Streptomyces sp. MI02-7b]MDX3074633.1 hypothetical protein [Streptomyces sp. MI02-7b]